jgi:hypothetical protein
VISALFNGSFLETVLKSTEFQFHTRALAGSWRARSSIGPCGNSRLKRAVFVLLKLEKSPLKRATFRLFKPENSVSKSTVFTLFKQELDSF